MRLLFACSFVVLMLCAGAVAYAQQDIDPPVLVAVSFEPSRVDTSRSHQVLTVTATITDDLSGFSYGWIYYEHPDTTQQHSVYLDTDDYIGDNQFMGTLRLPQYSAYGSWSMTRVSLYDAVGNRISLTRPADQAEIGSEVWPARFETFTFENAPSGPGQNHLLYMPVAIVP